MRRKPNKHGAHKMASDFGLIGQAIADAFRGMSSSSRLESRWSRLRSCGNC
jgi:hypothetical protein